MQSAKRRMAGGCHTKPRNVALLLNIVGFLDLFAVSLIIPMFSQHARQLDASPAVAGMIGSIYGGVQFFSSPLIGRWGDMSGRRHVLGWCLILTTLGYALLSLSTTVFIWCLSRLIVGMFKHIQDMSKAYLVDQMPKAEHTRLLGRMNSTASIGFTLGPIIGGHMAEMCGFYVMAAVTASIFSINVALVWLMLPEVKKSTGRDEDESKKKRGFNPFLFLKSFQKIEWTNLWDVFLFRFCMGFAVLLYRTNFSMILDYKYGASPMIIGYLMAYSGIVSTISGFFVGRVAIYYTSNKTMMTHIASVQMLSILALALAPTLWLVAIFMAPLAMANAVARVVATNMTLERGKGQETGALFGIGASILALARMAAPAVGGLAQEVHMSGPTILAAAVATIALGTLVFAPEPSPGSKEKKDQ